MKLLTLVALLFTSSAFASEVVFSCKAPKARHATLLEIDSEVALLGGSLLFRDKAYIPGNNGKKYYRYSNEYMDVLVPKLIASNRTNQGVIVVYTEKDTVRFSCIK